jgi:hypothetical protein
MMFIRLPIAYDQRALTGPFNAPEYDVRMPSRMLAWFSIAGLVASIAVCLLTYWDYAALDDYSIAWLLHPGVFVVWIPAVLMLRAKSREGDDLFSLLERAPVWLILLVLAALPIVFVIGIKSMTDLPGVPEYQDGQYVLIDHGRIVQRLTAAEFEHAHALETRGFSAIWMIFYGVAAAIHGLMAVGSGSMMPPHSSNPPRCIR